MRSAGLSVLPGLTTLPRVEPERVYFFATAEHRVRMTVEFYDRYESQAVRFEERSSPRRFCVSSAGEEN